MATIAIVWFIFYPAVVEMLASSINCTRIEGTLRLWDDLEQECFKGDHLAIVYAISIPGLLLWAFGAPLLGLYLIRKSREELKEIEH